MGAFFLGKQGRGDCREGREYLHGTGQLINLSIKIEGILFEVN